MVIKNVAAFSEYRTFEPKDIYIQDGTILAVTEPGAGCGDYNRGPDGETQDAEIDGRGLYAIPGLIDIHTHGCMGADCCDATLEALATMAEYEASCGVTTIFPTTMTLAEEELETIMGNVADYVKKSNFCETRSRIAGINMEGPFISPAKKGAQAAEHIRPADVAMYRHLQEAAEGLIALCDIAPEQEGAYEFIEALKDEVNISFAHTAADYDTAKRGYDLGANHATHLYNAMPPLAHRDPGVAGAALDSEQVYVELICDGVHIHPAMVRATLEMFGEERVVMISDSMRATGLSDGVYTLGGQDVQVVGKRATLVSDGAIAGSCTNLMDCVRIAVRDMRIPLELAVGCATINAAKSVGIYDRCGSLTEGKVADIVLLHPDLSTSMVILRGQRL